MALATNSYGTVEEVKVRVRHLLDGEASFSDSTQPNYEDVEAIIDQVSGVLNMALSAAGLDIPITQTDAVQASDYFVVVHSVCELRQTYPHLGITGEERVEDCNLVQDAHDFAEMNAEAFTNLGETVGSPSSDGLVFTGLEKHSERSDPDNDSREQPKFRRGQFDA